MYIRPSYKSDNNRNDAPTDYVEPLGLENLILFRWLSVIVMYFMAAFIYFINPLGIQILPLLIVAFTTLFYNLTLTAQSRRGSSSRKPTLMLEFVFDLLAWTTFLYFSGGVNNPMVFILLPFVAIGAAILSIKQAYMFGLLAILIYSLFWKFQQHQGPYGSQEDKQFYLLSMWVTFTISVMIFIWLITHMTRAIRKYNRDLNAAYETALRDKWIVSLGGLAAGTAHELSTPLSTLSTLVEEMCTSQEPVYVCRTDLELMESQLAVCRQAISRLTQQAGCPCAEAANICAADEWLRRLGQTWKTLHPGTDIEMVLDPCLSRLRLAPSIPLEQALCNLVDNAIAVHSGGIKLSARCSDENLEIQVVDHGPGIQQVTLQHLERGLPQKSEQGLGIGLVLTKSAVERYGGKIEFNNLLQGGTEARVVLPLDGFRAT